MHILNWQRLSIRSFIIAAAIAAIWPGLSLAEEPGLGNNLSVPTIFVPSVGVGSLACTEGDDTLLPDPGAASTVFPGYWVQGEATWQADCAVAADNTVTATAAWGDNLAGMASLAAGHPVRVELALLADAPAYPMTGFSVEKLQPELLDRESAYGTNDGSGVTPYPEVGVWNAGVTLNITGPTSVSIPFGAELNATGRVVYGYNWQPTVAGTYTLTANVPSVTLLGSDMGSFTAHSTTIIVEVTSSPGGGGGAGGAGGSGGSGGSGGPGGSGGSGGSGGAGGSGAGNGRFASDPVFDASGTGVAVFTGGTADELVDAVESAGGSGAWVRGGDGGYVHLGVGGPSFTNDSFNDAFPDGLTEPTEVVVSKKGH